MIKYIESFQYGTVKKVGVINFQATAKLLFTGEPIALEKLDLGKASLNMTFTKAVGLIQGEMGSLDLVYLPCPVLVL